MNTPSKERSRNNSITLVLQGAASRLSSPELATHLASWNCPSYSWTAPNGESLYGNRYNPVAQAFGCHGVRRNLCQWSANTAPDNLGELAAALVAATAKAN